MPRAVPWSAFAALLAVSLLAPAPAFAQGSLNVYCSVQLEWCQSIANEFTRQSGIKVSPYFSNPKVSCRPAGLYEDGQLLQNLRMKSSDLDERFRVGFGQSR